LALASVIAVGSTTAMGSYVELQIGAGDVRLDSGALPGMFASPGDAISDDDLIELNSTLVESGVATEGYLSLMLADTEEGLALVVLVGGSDGFAGDKQAASLLGVSMIWDGTTDTSIVNLNSGGSWSASPLSDDQMLGSGAFQWQHGLSWEALALTNLFDGQALSMDLIDLGILPVDGHEVVLQLITFGGSGTWEVAATQAFDDTHQIAVAGLVTIPAPAVVGTLVFAMCRRNRKRA